MRIAVADHVVCEIICVSSFRPSPYKTKEPSHRPSSLMTHFDGAYFKFTLKLLNILFATAALNAVRTPSSLVLCASSIVETLQPTALGLIVLWPSLATVIVALRVYTRISMRQFFLGKIYLLAGAKS